MGVRPAFCVSLAVAGVAALLAAGARAATPDEARAEHLFEEARQLAKNERFAEACAKFEESERLDAQIGTEFYWADCLEHEGRLGAALEHYQHVATRAAAKGEADKKAFAETRAQALIARMPKIVVTAAADAPAGLSLRIDESDVTAEAAASGFSVDPGPHRVRASAPGRAPFEANVEARPGERTPVRVVFADSSAPAVEAAPASTWSTQRTVGVVAAATGLVGVGIGSAFGLVSFAKFHDSNVAHCDPQTNRCDTTGRALRDQSISAATASTVSFVVGGVLVAGGVVLFVTAPRKKQGNAGRASFVIGPRGAAVFGEF